MIRITERETYKQYGRVLCIENGVIEAFVTLDVGPRIIRFAFKEGDNVLRDDREAFVPRTDKAFTDLFGEGKIWENLGGHRLWVSPERYPHTYYPDTAPVHCELIENGAVFTPKAETEIGIAKQLVVAMHPEKAEMSVTMRVRNIADETKTFAIWGLTVCAQGGRAVIPMNTEDTDLLPNRMLSIWPYTDMTDKRICFDKDTLYVRQDPQNPQPLKLGLNLTEGQVWYELGETVFKKQYETHHPNGVYPDGGCSFETYTNDQFIELESLGTLAAVAPGETADLTETWSLQKQERSCC